MKTTGVGSRDRAHAMVLAAAALIGVVLFSVWAAPIFAKMAYTQRTVQGRVVASGDRPVANAIVYLSDMRTKTVESYITQQDGAYRFEELSSNDDYKLWARANGKKSKVTTLSSFDDRSTFHVILKIGSGK